jgi:hypothetical protein
LRDRGFRRAKAAELQIVLDVHGGEQAAVLRHQAEPGGDAVLDLQQRHVLAGERGGALQRQDAHDGRQQRGLAGAVGADDSDDLVVADVERNAAHGLDLAVGNMDAGNVQQRAHALTPR